MVVLKTSILLALVLPLAACSLSLKNSGPGFGPPGWAPFGFLPEPEMEVVKQTSARGKATPPVTVRSAQVVEVRLARVVVTDWKDAPPSKAANPSYYGLWAGFRDLVAIVLFGE